MSVKILVTHLNFAFNNFEQNIQVMYLHFGFQGHHNVFPALIFLTYETEFVLFIAVPENSVLSMGWDSSHETLKVTSVVYKRDLTYAP